MGSASWFLSVVWWSSFCWHRSELISKRSARKHCGKTASTSYDFSEQSSEETVKEKFPISDKAVFRTVHFLLKHRGPTYVHFNVAHSKQRAFFCFLIYSYCRPVNARQERYENETSYIRGQRKDVETLLTISDRANKTTILLFLSQTIEKCGFERSSESQACYKVQSFLKGKSLD